MLEQVTCTVEVLGNYIKITPVDGVKDNSIYDIKLKDLRSLTGGRSLDTSIKVCTALSPSYSDLTAVESLLEACKIPAEIILYHIREASKHVDYVKGAIKIDIKNIPYEVTQYVKYKAAADSLLKYYIERAASGGTKGQLGDVLYEQEAKLPDISDLLKYLKGLAAEWLLEVQGYKKGIAKPKSALRGSKAVTPPIMTNLGLDYDRGTS